jgi:membrane protease YdiL (CAAX protease family)
LVIGAALLGYSLTRPPGDESFYWLTLALAGVWALGAFASGPLHLGCVRFRGRNQRPVITGSAIGLVLGAVFLVGGLIAREIPGVREYITRVLEFADYGPLVLVTFITVINGVAEELFFRGALYTALGKWYPVAVSTVLYVCATAVTTGNPMLGVAAVIVGSVRLAAPSHRRGARTDADPFLLGSCHGARVTAGVRRLAQRIRQLVLSHPGRVHGYGGEDDRCNAGNQENGLHRNDFRQRADNRERHRHEAERDEEVQARHSAQHLRRDAPLQQRAPDDHARAVSHADDERRDGHQRERRRDADNY